MEWKVAGSNLTVHFDSFLRFSLKKFGSSHLCRNKYFCLALYWIIRPDKLHLASSPACCLACPHQANLDRIWGVWHIFGSGVRHQGCILCGVCMFILHCPQERNLIKLLRCIKAWDMQFCVKNIMVIQNLLYLGQIWFYDCWYFYQIYDQIGHHSNQSSRRGNQQQYKIFTNKNRELWSRRWP